MSPINTQSKLAASKGENAVRIQRAPAIGEVVRHAPEGQATDAADQAMPEQADRDTQAEAGRTDEHSDETQARITADEGIFEAAQEVSADSGSLLADAGEAAGKPASSSAAQAKTSGGETPPIWLGGLLLAGAGGGGSGGGAASVAPAATSQVNTGDVTPTAEVVAAPSDEPTVFVALDDTPPAEVDSGDDSQGPTESPAMLFSLPLFTPERTHVDLVDLNDPLTADAQTMQNEFSEVDLVTLNDGSDGPVDPVRTLDASIGRIEVQATQRDGISQLDLGAADGGSLTMTDGSVEVGTAGMYAQASLELQGVSGNIADLRVRADGWMDSAQLDVHHSTALVEFAHVGASNQSTASLWLCDMEADIQTLEVSAQDGDAEAWVSFNQGTLRTLSITTECYDTRASHGAVVWVDQAEHGGDVYISDYSAGSTATVELMYANAAADNIYFGQLNWQGEFEAAGSSQVALYLSGQNLDTAWDDPALYASRTTLWGFDEARHSISFGFDGDAPGVRADAPFHTLEEVLAAADATLDGHNRTFFGSVDWDLDGQADVGYLAYDADGAGISALVELAGVADYGVGRLDDWQLIGG